MPILIPILAAFLRAAASTLDKVVLSLKNVSFKTYTGLSFPAAFAITFVIFLIFRPPLSLDLFPPKMLFLFSALTAIVIGSNLVYYRALDRDKLTEIGTIDLLSYIPTIIATALIFTDERDFLLIIPAITASGAVVWSHWRGDRFRIKKSTLPYFIWIFTAAPLNAPISKEILKTLHPITYELLITGLVALILGPLFFKYEKKISSKGLGLLLLSSFFWVVTILLILIGFQTLGVVHTLLLFSLAPLLIYLSSVIFLKEKPQRKKTIAFVIVLISITVAQVLG